MGAATEQRAEQLVAHGQVVQDLQHVDQYGDGYGVQHDRLERVTKVARVDHLEQQH